MIQFTIKHVASGEKFDFTADSRHVLVWEKTSKKNETFVQLISEMNMVALYRLAHITARALDVEVPKDRAEFENDWVIDFASEEVTVPTVGAVSIEM